MIKRIYLLLISGSLLFAAPHSSVMNSSNIKKIIKSKDKIIVIIRENGKDKKVVLDSKTLESLSKKSKHNSKSKKSVAKKDSKKSTKKITKKENKGSKDKLSKKDSKKSKLKKGEYKVVSGDTLFSIARKYKVSISEITKLNKLGTNTLLHPGQILKIPGLSYTQEAKEAVAKNKKTVYKVKKGDTLYSIARVYNMRVDTLRKMNNLKKHPKLKPGMELNVLGKPITIAKRKKPTKHIVKAGDTLWSIAQKYGLTLYELRILNPKVTTRALRKGSILNVSKAKAIKLAKRIRKLKKRRKHNLNGALAKYSRSYGGSSNVVRYAKRWLGSRYVWGASRPGAFDCSGFTQYVMKKTKGRVIPRVSRRQAYYGKYVSRRNLRAGDLIFFDTSRSRRGYVNHVGIYIGNNKFIHASSAKHRVVITSLNKPFYSARFMWGRRIN